MAKTAPKPISAKERMKRYRTTQKEKGKKDSRTQHQPNCDCVDCSMMQALATNEKKYGSMVTDFASRTSILQDQILQLKSMADIIYDRLNMIQSEIDGLRKPMASEQSGSETKTYSQDPLVCQAELERYYRQHQRPKYW